MELAGWLVTSLIIAEAALQVALAVRVLMRRLQTGVTTSWLVLILLLPVVGLTLYLLVGESRVGRLRTRREARIHPAYDEYVRRMRARNEHIERELSELDDRLAREAEATVGLPPLAGNDYRLLEGSDAFFDAVLREVDAAERSVLMEFFIWVPAGRVEEVAAALVRARERGVECRVLVDAVGGRPFVRSGMRRELERAGVEVALALPARVARTPVLRRIDHRNHRKMVVVDQRVAFTGSMNMADPAHFKVKEGLGQWVDLVTEVRGPIVELCELLLLRDLEIETGEDLSAARERLEERAPDEAGHMAAQLVPSGPGIEVQGIHNLMVSTFFASSERLTITTPYFVPDQSVVSALQSAARRGVDVTVIVPERSDTVLTHYAGRAFFEDLLDAGVKIALFRGGLLHTKSVVVDDEIALFGTVNIDPRSFWLNFELTTAVFDNEFTRLLYEKQQEYLSCCELVDLDAWRKRRFTARLAENAAQLFAPLL